MRYWHFSLHDWFLFVCILQCFAHKKTVDRSKNQHMVFKQQRKVQTNKNMDKQDMLDNQGQGKLTKITFHGLS